MLPHFKQRRFAMNHVSSCCMLVRQGSCAKSLVPVCRIFPSTLLEIPLTIPNWIGSHIVSAPDHILILILIRFGPATESFRKHGRLVLDVVSYIIYGMLIKQSLEYMILCLIFGDPNYTPSRNIVHVRPRSAGTHPYFK